jgi:hypothetical protein
MSLRNIRTISHTSPGLSHSPSPPVDHIPGDSGKSKGKPIEM